MHNYPKLTKMQELVLSLAAQGVMDKQIAFRADISPENVQYHLRGAKERLGAENVKHAIAIYSRRQALSEMASQLGRNSRVSDLNKVTEQLDIRIFRDMICEQISSHTNIERLTRDQWVEFVEEYSVFVNKIIAHKYGDQ